MGSCSEHREPGMSNLEWLRTEVVGKPEYGEILDAATVNNKVIYAAWKLGSQHGQQEGLVVGLVVLIQWTRDWFNFTHKEMTDSMGPNEAECPERILKLLGPPENEWAADWRRACEAHNAKRANARSVKKGAVVKFAKPLTFVNGDELDTFVFEKGNNFRGHGGYGRYRISGWRSSEFTVMQAAA